MFTPSLDDAPLAIALGAAKYEVRLRPAGDDDGAMDRAGQHVLTRWSDNDDAENGGLPVAVSPDLDGPQLSVFKSIYAVLQDDHTGLFPLALAMLRPKLTKTEASKLTESLKLPAIDGLSEDAGRAPHLSSSGCGRQCASTRSSFSTLPKMWTAPVDLRASGSGTADSQPSNREATRGDVASRQWIKDDYASVCEPAMRAVFAPGEHGRLFLQASKIALDAGDKAEWLRCERCTSVSPRNALLGDRCGYCGGTAKAVDPANDAVFRSRKAFIGGCGSGSATRRRLCAAPADRGRAFGGAQRQRPRERDVAQ